MSKRLALGLDIGGTKLAAGVGEASGELLSFTTQPTPQESTPQQVVTLLVEMAEAALTDAGISKHDLAGVGVSYGGPVNQATGVTVCCHHLTGWENFALREMLSQELGAWVQVDNDANVSALGEACFGAGRGYRHLLYLTVSSGIGAGVIIDRRIYRGATGLAGEIGHIVIDTQGPACPCGQRGCLEAMASGWAIGRHGQEMGFTRDQQIPDAAVVFAAVASGNQKAREVIVQASEALGRGIAMAVNLLDPGLVVIGGGVAKAGETLLQPVRDAVARWAMEPIGSRVRIIGAELDNQSGVLGGVALITSPTEEVVATN